jgi:eukaryotic-like serine/threonine-protein kinase
MASSGASAPRVLGRYAVYGEIAAGGMATVYIGRLRGPVGFARRVAIKSLHPQLAKDPDFLSMFLDEARLVGHIRHTNVVPVLDVISVEGELHLVMEYVEGESLSRVLRCSKNRQAVTPVAIAVGVMIGVLDGLHAAHEARGEDGSLLSIVHRDVSPQNILVGVDGIAKILDFGIAKAVGRMQTTRGDQLKGKLAYMAPEQLARDPLDRRADVYAASIVLWELLTGERLFHADDEISTFRKAMETIAPPPSSVTPRVPAALDAIVLQGLARDRAQRFTTAREMAQALDATGLAATPREIGQWLGELCRESLAERAERIEAHERKLVPTEPSAAGQGSPTATAHFGSNFEPRADAPTRVLKLEGSPGPRLKILLGTLAAAGLLGLLLLLRRAPVAQGIAHELAPAPRAAAEQTAQKAVTGPLARAEPQAGASERPPPSLEAAKGAALASTSAARQASRPLAKGQARPRAPARKAGCDVPFTVDAHGVKVPKLECL